MIGAASRTFIAGSETFTAIAVRAYESGDYAADVCYGPRKEV